MPWLLVLASALIALSTAACGGGLDDWQPGGAFASSTYQAAADYIAAVELYRAGNAAAGTNALDSGDRGMEAATAGLARAEDDAGLAC